MARLLALLILAAAACAPAGPPQKAADLTGAITRLTNNGNTVLVEEKPQEPQGGAKASVTIGPDTRIWNAVGSGSSTRMNTSELKTGMIVRVWFDGPVAMSYPVQGKAADIAVDRLASATPLRIASSAGP